MKITIELKLILVFLVMLTVHLLWYDDWVAYLQGPHSHLENFSEVNWGEIFKDFLGLN